MSQPETQLCICNKLTDKPIPTNSGSPRGDVRQQKFLHTGLRATVHTHHSTHITVYTQCRHVHHKAQKCAYLRGVLERRQVPAPCPLKEGQWFRQKRRSSLGAPEACPRALRGGGTRPQRHSWAWGLQGKVANPELGPETGRKLAGFSQ